MAFTSGTTNGTPGSIRKTDVLSTTTAPAFTARGANLALTLPPTAKNIEFLRAFPKIQRVPDRQVVHEGLAQGAHAAAGREQTDVDSLEGTLIQHFNAKLLALKGQKLPHGSLRSQKPQFTDGKFAFFQNFAHLLADCAGSADDGDVVLFFLHD